MLIRQQRFHSRRDVVKTYRRGASVRVRTSAVRVVARNDEMFRVAVVVSKKVHKSAVVRNRIRRRIYECLRVYYTQSLKGYDIIVTVFDVSLATLSYDELVDEINRLLLKAQLISPKQKTHGIVEGKKE